MSIFSVCLSSNWVLPSRLIRTDSASPTLSGICVSHLFSVCLYFSDQVILPGRLLRSMLSLIFLCISFSLLFPPLLCHGYSYMSLSSLYLFLCLSLFSSIHNLSLCPSIPVFLCIIFLYLSVCSWEIFFLFFISLLLIWAKWILHWLHYQNSLNLSNIFGRGLPWPNASGR